MPRFMAKRVLVNGIQQWVSGPIMDEDMSPVKKLDTSLKNSPYKKEYIHYGVWEDED